MRTPWIGAAICIFGIVIAILVYFFAEWSNQVDSREKMLLELFKFAITTVLVGGAALFYDSLSKKAEANRKAAEKEKNDRDRAAEQEKADRDKAAAREKSDREAAREKERQERAASENRLRDLKSARQRRLEEFLREATEEYNKIKYLRRELRNALVPKEGDSYLIEGRRYDDLMRGLNRGQLKLEQFRRILESKPSYLTFMGDNGIIWISQAEEYLRRVTREYEYHNLDEAPGDAGNFMVTPESRLFQYTVSRSNKLHDGTSVNDHFLPLDNFFRMLAQHIESLD